MEQPAENFSYGPFRTPSTANSEKEKNVWRLPSRGSNSYQGSSDASLFSTSLPVHLPNEKFNFEQQIGQSLDDDFPSLSKVYLENAAKGSCEDEKRGPLQNLLPGDEVELLAGLMDDFDLSELPTQIDDLDDDFFGSGGGLEIESEHLVGGTSKLTSYSPYGFSNGTGNVSGEHPFGEHPSRTLFVRNINSNVEDSELRILFEQYGDIRKLYTACKHRGFVMISYYDIRAARNAMRALQNKPLRRRKLDIHFSIPKDKPSEKDINQGTLVVFNLDASVSNDDLRQIFGAYGEVKEIRETPHKRHHKFIEYYDVRSAEVALKALNRSDIAGKRIKLEPSRPGGARRSLMQQLSPELDQEESRAFLHQVSSPIADSPPGSWPNFGSPIEQNPLISYSQTPKIGSISPVGSNPMPGLASILPSLSNPVKISPIGKDPRPISPFDYSKPSSVGTLSGPQFLWGSSSTHSENINSPAWPSSIKGRAFNFPYTGLRSSFLDSQHHVGSAPSGIPLERHFGFYPDSPKPSAFGVTNFGRNDGNRAMNVNVNAMNTGASFPMNFADGNSPSSRMMLLPRNNTMYYGTGLFGVTGSDGMNIRGRRAAENGSLIDNKKQFQLDLEKIVKGEDNRTTLMLKNIPNKYTSKMLLAAMDETHKGTYDFFYLPIDFKNKCNVGYAFINMISPLHIITFYEEFNGKKWEKFNSEKVASLAYARIQGKAALVSHFQNSSLMNEDKSCRPILFQSEGQDNVILEPYPSGNLNILIRQPDGSYAGDTLDDPDPFGS